MSIKMDLIKKGFKSSSLDELVDEAASEMATNVNNDGMGNQLDFLLITCGWNEERIYDALEVQA